MMKRILNEEISSILEDAYEEITHDSLFQDFRWDKEHGVSKIHWDLIPAQQYYNLLRRFMDMGDYARIPEYPVRNWMKLIVRNTVTLSYLTDIAGHSEYFPYDDFEDAFGNSFDGELCFEDCSMFLEDIGFYDWAALPDGSDAISDYGLKPLFDIISQYDEFKTTPEQTLVLINRCIDVYHQRGDLCSCFIEGGSKACSNISQGQSLNESQNYIHKGIVTPDRILISNEKPLSLDCYADDARAFAYNPFAKTKHELVLIGEYGSTHYDLLGDYYGTNQYGIPSVDCDSSVLGRLWENDKVICFWGKGWKNHLKDIIKELNKKSGRNFLDWNIVFPINNNLVFWGPIKEFLNPTPTSIIDNSTVLKKRNRVEWDSAEREGRRKYDYYVKNSPYADERYKFALRENKMKRRITKSDICRIVKECVHSILCEEYKVTGRNEEFRWGGWEQSNRRNYTS